MKKTFILLILSMVFRSVGLSQCDEGFIWIDDPPLNEYNWDGYNCFYESDLNVLSDFIQINPSLTGEHLDIGWQVWSDGRLEGLTLYALQITSVPDNIGDLSSLNYLNLHFNQITNIPETIGGLVQLTELFLENNLIETLPESIGNLSNLVTLNINENQLISIPESIGTLGSLEELLLFNNELTFLPESICNIFPNLSYCDFSANYICPPYPDCIENVGFQFTDDCPNCNEGEVELWGECYNIEETTFLQLSWNGLTGEIPPTIGNLTYLTKLWLYSNELSGEIPLEIGNLTNLTEFYLWENQLTGEIPLEIGNLINLDGIDLHSNQFTGEIPSTIGNLTNLTYLNFSLNELTGEIPESICNLTIDFSIYNFHIENNQFCPPYPSCIEEYVGYQDTTNCSSCEEGEVMLWNECYSIEYTTELDLSYGGLTGEIPPEIGNLINLISLILKENQLNGEIPPEISYLTNLTNLDLGGNQLNGAIPLEIGYLTNLTILDLGGNQLNGAIPTEIGNLTNLTDLELGGNHLTGEIPSEIDNLVNLIFLHLEYNQLTGEIPPEIGNLINLIWLNLVNNQLIGEIPSSICNLDMNWSNPENFNIYDNQLCPPYPSCVEDYVGEQDTTNCGQGNVTVDYQSGWNLIGLPLDVEDASYSILFPESIEGTLYSFNGGYNLATSLIQGESYWLRFANDGNTTITGNIINELTISLSEGWNLITGLSTSFNISDIQDPDGIIIAGTVYGFASGGYSNEEIIEPGKGYWVRTNSSGSITLINE